MACLSTKRNEWTTRLEHQLKVSESAHFVTLTYSEENIPRTGQGVATLRKEDVQKFMKRLRKGSQSKLKYYLVGEYGENTSRPHYHAVIFNLKGSREQIHIKLLKAWNNGLIHFGTVTSASIKYTLKYMLQKFEECEIKREKEFALMSKGLGKNYVVTHIKYHKKNLLRKYVLKEGGVKHRLPRYYADNIYNRTEKEKQKLLLPKDELDDAFNAQLEVDRKEAYKRQIKKNLKNNSKF